MSVFLETWEADDARQLINLSNIILFELVDLGDGQHAVVGRVDDVYSCRLYIGTKHNASVFFEQLADALGPNWK